jgi:Ca-activated chloride channel family protein
MTHRDPETDFQRLRDGPVPRPSAEAKARAIAAASSAFAEAVAKNAPSAQGSAAASRLTSSAHTGRWRTAMQQNRVLTGSVAASVLVIPLAAILAVQGGLPTLERRAPVGAVPPAVETPPVPKIAAPADVPPPAGVTPQADADAARRAGVPPTSERELKRSGPATEALEAFGIPAQDSSSPDPSSRGRDVLLYATPSERAPAAPAPLSKSGHLAVAPLADASAPQSAPSRDRFYGPQRNGVVATAENPVSTFSIDTDTASYAWIRRLISQGTLPAPEQVRTEELVNYFPYDYPLPESREQPFRPDVVVFPSPWNKATRIVRIGIKGFELAPRARPAANLVFLVDTSGSMNEPDKLPLVKASLKLLLDRLEPGDRVALVTYAGAAGVALEPTPASDRAGILAAIDRLGAAGSTAGAAGISEAYALARRSFVEGGVNRVILATDGDFNVGISDDDSLTRLIETERRSGIFLSVLGFGQGNYNDALMQRLAQNGNGSASYIDGLDEAQKVLQAEATSTLFPVAKDVKIQVEFNPSKVSEYRLIGYETRLLDRTDFKNDKVDAGEVGAGAAVTALYEIAPAGSSARLSEDLRYGQAPPAAAPARSSELGFLKIRYKLPGEETSRLIETPISSESEVADLELAPADARFAAAVAALSQKLRGSPEVADMSYDAVIALADGARGADPFGYRSGFVRLVRSAKSLAR